LAEYAKLKAPDNQTYATRIIEQKIIKGKLLDYGTIPAWCPQELIKIIKKCCKTSVAERIDSPATLIAKLHNVRAHLADWRFEPEPVLHSDKARIKIVGSGNNHTLLKMAKAGSEWRNIRSIAPCSLKQAVTAALTQ
jgi:hypothetical protein